MFKDCERKGKQLLLAKTTESERTKLAFHSVLRQTFVLKRSRSESDVNRIMSDFVPMSVIPSRRRVKTRVLPTFRSKSHSNVTFWPLDPRFKSLTFVWRTFKTLPYGRGGGEGGSNRQTNFKPRQTTSKSSGGRCFALLLRALSCLGCSLLSQPLTCTCTCTCVRLCHCVRFFPHSGVSPFRHPRALSQVRPQQRGVAVVVLLYFCERSVISQSCLACTSVSHFYAHSVLSRFRHPLSPWDHGKERWRWRSLPRVLLCLCERSSLSITSLVYHCLSVESVPYPHSVLSPFLESSLCETTAKNCGGRCRFVVLCEHCPPLFTQASFGIAPRLYVPLSLSLCASHCVALVRTSASLWHSRHRSWYVVFPKHDGTR